MAQTDMDDGYSVRGRGADTYTRSERRDVVPAYPSRSRSFSGVEDSRDRNDGWSAKIEQDRENDRNGVNNE
jgi:hypothetical protein